MLTIKQLWGYTQVICGEHDIPLPGEIRYNPRLSATLGRCKINNNSGETIIELNKKFCVLNRDEVIIGVLKHELAHLLHFNHGAGFKALCAEMGISVHTDKTFKNIKYQQAKYTYKCIRCGEIFPRTQKFKNPVSCAECGEKKYSEKCRLILVDQS